MPYAKRWSTPTTTRQTEEALIVGFWAGLHRGKEVIQSICEKHSVLLTALDKDVEKRTAPTLPPPSMQPPYGGGMITPYPPSPNSEPPREGRLTFGKLELELEETTTPASTEHTPQGGMVMAPALQGGMVCPLCRQIIKAGEVHRCSSPEDVQPPTVHEVLHNP
jgi:hypothetical protein